jgi:hypothetical protein
MMLHAIRDSVGQEVIVEELFPIDLSWLSEFHRIQSLKWSYSIILAKEADGKLPH